MKISVIIPIYNAEKFLQRCLDSLINQNFKNYEVILVNDGSRDCSFQICEQYVGMDNRFSIISKSNEGVSKARNTGILKSKFDMLCFVDADDHLDQNYLQGLVDDWSKSENTELVFQGFRRVFEDGRANTTNIPNLILDASDTEKLFTVGKVSLNGNPFSKLFKKSIIKENNLLFKENFTYNEDMIFVLEYILCCKNKIVFSDTIHYNYMINMGSLTNKLLKANEYFEPYIYYKKLFVEHYKIDLDDQNFAIVYENFKINLHMYMNATLLGKCMPLESFTADDLDIYTRISRTSNLSRRFLDFFILRKIYYIPRIITRLFFKSKYSINN